MAPVVDNSFFERKDELNHDSLVGGSWVPMKKRKAPPQTSDNLGSTPLKSEGRDDPQEFSARKAMKSPNAKARQLRLEQNRQAARESRRRKKGMVEELQRSLTFFSKANQSLKQQNDNLTRYLLQAHSQLAQLGEPIPGIDAKAPKNTTTNQNKTLSQISTANSSQPPNHDSWDVPVPVGSIPLVGPVLIAANIASPIPTFPQNIAALQPGATMQAMANFQQAASAAMQAASCGMHALGATVQGTPETRTVASLSRHEDGNLGQGHTEV